MKNPKAVFFDAGHTLLRAHPSIGAIYSAETRAFGAEISGETFERVFREVFKDFGPKYAADTNSMLPGPQMGVAMLSGVSASSG